MNDATRVPILYLAPWVDFGGSDKGTIDWFRWLNQERFRASLITTQPSANRRIAEIVPHAAEIWALPELMAGHLMPRFIIDFVVSRGIRVIHIMNARLAFELLPDLVALDDPPAVVVQFHVEEEDRSGYVRMVTTRYGNLVDAFSVSSEHLARAVEGYDIRRDRIFVVPTGVDCEGEFCPARTVPQALGTGPHVLYPGRLTAQKDPLLMVEVAAKVAARRPDARFHVVGEGELEGNVRAAVRRHGLDGTVTFHPPTAAMAPWYAASDLLLMTSAFEGVPYVLYEAMAMGLASVVPRLPGNVELLDEGGGILVAPRDEDDAYATAVLSLLNGNGEAERLGQTARERVRDLSVQRMTAAHAAVYERLLDQQRPTRRTARPTPLPPVHRLPARPSRGQPRVTVVVPCFNHGRFLAQALASIRAQTYPELEIIVVDDASDDGQTVALLDQLRREGDVTVVRQAINAGPSAARNAGIARARGRYILPVDADNVLLDDAVAALVAQLQSAGEQTGFVYPNLQFFGNRHDYFAAPGFDLQQLRVTNYCDTCSLIDRSVFDAGFTFPEDITLGHEDWDFFLTLATHGIHGEPANGTTLLYRKTGFTRSDTVEYQTTSFADTLRDRHPALFPTHARDVSRVAARRQEATLKAVWQPAISVLVLEDVDAGSATGQQLLAAIAEQTMGDAEIIAPFRDTVARACDGPFLRRLPPGLPDRMTSLLAMARANYVVIVQRNILTLLQTPGFLERLVHARRNAGRSVAVALADGGPTFAGLTFGIIDDPPPDAAPFAIALFERFDGPRLPAFTAARDNAVANLVTSLEVHHVVQWRHAPDRRQPLGERSSRRERHDLTVRQPRDARDRAVRQVRRYSQPMLPANTWIRRWETSSWPAWVPPETTVLIRHKEIVGETRLVTLGGDPPTGYEVEHWLGAVHRFGPPGTARIEATIGAGGHQTAFGVVPPEAPAPACDDTVSLGHVEQAAFPLLHALHVARVDATGQLTLVAGATDVLHDASRTQTLLGYVEAFPNLPATPVFERPASRRYPMLLRGLAETRHVYGVGALDGGRVVAALGRLPPVPSPGSVAARVLADGTFVTDRYRPAPCHTGLAHRVRWAGAPLSWRGQENLGPRGRATAQRLARTIPTRTPRRAAIDETGLILGYLYTTPGPDRVELFSAVHPITADQIVTPFALEATDMGYVDVTSVGYTSGTLSELTIERYRVPWASRFGLATRHR